MNKIWNWLKVALGIVFSVLAYIFFTRRGEIKKSEIKKKVKEVKTKVEKQEKIVKKLEKKAKDRKEKAKKLSERLKKHFNIFIVMCLIGFITLSTVVGITSSTLDKLIIPDTYNELVEAYKDMASIAISYQGLYNEAEADNQALMEVVKNLQSLIKVQQDIIDDLLRRNKLGIFTGINYVPLKPAYSGIIAGVTFEF